MIAAPTVCRKSEAQIDLTKAVIDPDWGSQVTMASAQRLQLMTSPRPYAYSCILHLPKSENGQLLVELDLVVASGSIGVAVLGANHSELQCEVWLDADNATKVIVLPVAEAQASMGVVIRNGSTPYSGAVIIQAARLLTAQP